MQNLKTAQNNVDTLPLKELVDFSLGGDWGKNPDEKLEDYVKVKVVRGTEFANWWKHKANTAALRQIKKSSFEKRQLKSGDLVVEVSGGGPSQPVGRIVVIDDNVIANSDYPLVCSNFFRQIRLKKEYVPAFVRLSIYFDYLSGKLDLYQTSSTNLRNLNFNDFLSNIEIPVLPKEEQGLIASKLENAIDTINLTKVKLVKGRILVKKFRQSVLSAAITGKLTEDWRENNPQAPVSTIVEGLKQSHLNEAKTPINKKRVDELYAYKEENNTDELPDGWGYISLNKLCSSFQYGTSTKSNTSGKVPVLRMGNLQKGEVDWTSLVYTSDENEIEKYKLKTGDVLFNRTNSPELVGKTSIYRGEQEAIFAGYLIKINNYPALNSEYLNYCLNSHYAREFCYQVKTDGVSQSNINAQKLGKFEIPFCSSAEQAEIVRLVKQYFDVANQVEKQIAKAEKRVGKLTQAILAKTFRGEEYA